MASRKNRPAKAGRTRVSPGRVRLLWVAGVVIVLIATFLLIRSRGNKPVGPGQVASIPTALEMGEDKLVFARYAGAAACQECHPEEHRRWSTSHHGLAERPMAPALDNPAFEPPREFEIGSVKSEAKAADGKFEVVTVGYDNKREPYRTQRVIGVDPLRQFLVDASGGRLQTLEIAYDPHRGEWFNVYGNEDRRPGEWGHWTGRGMNWNSMCAACHNTRLRKNYDGRSDTYATAMAEMSVSCEACHGPMKDHAQWQKSHRGSNKADPTLKPRTIAQTLDTCGSCHARRAELTGDFRPGDAFNDHYALAFVDDTDLYYPDGQVREEDYEFASFLSSKMHAAGVRCLDCHDPHSSQTILPGNPLCIRCHNGSFKGAPVIEPVSHSFHKPDSTGAQCINCHMPQTVYMQRHWRHDHGFTVPDPLLTKEFGVPNACNRCHKDKDAQWALDAAGKWYGPKMQRPSRERAQWIAKARSGDSSARDPLIKTLAGDKQPFWQAVAANMLGQWAGEPRVDDALLKALEHPDPLVRAAAIRSLTPRAEQTGSPAQWAIRKLLDDPVRTVRNRAAWALRASVDPQSVAGRELLHYLEINADQPTGQLQKGVYHLARNENEKALSCLQTAVKWDPNSAPLRHEFAVVLSVLGRNQEAIEQIEAACRLDPRESEYRYKLGLAWNEVGRPDKTIEALQEAVRLNPRHGRAWYNLGLAQNTQGQPERAVDSLLRAESASPGDPQIPYARATILARMSRVADARQAALRALQIDNRYGPAMELLNSLPQQ